MLYFGTKYFVISNKALIILRTYFELSNVKLLRCHYIYHLLGLKHPRYPVTQGQRVQEDQRSSETILHHIETKTATTEKIPQEID